MRGSTPLDPPHDSPPQPRSIWQGRELLAGRGDEEARGQRRSRRSPTRVVVSATVQGSHFLGGTGAMRILGRVLLGLGAFLLIAAILCTAWAPDQVKKTPLDVDTTTFLEGEAAKLDTATGEFEKRPIY